MKLFLKWVVTSLAVLAAPHLVSGVHVENLGTALAVGIVLTLLNLVVRPLFILITLPFTLLSFGLFIFVINALLFQFAGHLVNGFHVESFGSAFLGSLLVSSVSFFMNRFTRPIQVSQYKVYNDKSFIDV